MTSERIKKAMAATRPKTAAQMARAHTLTVVQALQETALDPRAAPGHRLRAAETILRYCLGPPTPMPVPVDRVRTPAQEARVRELFQSIVNTRDEIIERAERLPARQAAVEAAERELGIPLPEATA